MASVLPDTFFARSPVVVARALLGKVLCRRIDDHVIGGVITETEAYWGDRDPGSHAFRGPTPRTEVMFGAPGLIYVYFIYGMYHCVNIVTGQEGKASAVLLRGVHILPSPVQKLLAPTAPGNFAA